MELLTKEEIQYFKNHQNEITTELLTELRSKGKEGKQQALDILDMPKDEENFYLDAFNNRISFNGNRILKKAYTKLKLADIHIIEIEKSMEDIFYFMDNYVKVMTPQDGIDFVEMREYQKNFLKILTNPDLEKVLGLLPRRAGKSVICGIWLSWVFTFRRDMTLGVLSNKGASSREFLDKCKIVLDNLPIWLKPGVSIWNRGSIKSEQMVNILTDVPGENALRGFGPSYIIFDEVSWVSSPELYLQTADSLFPTVNALAEKKIVLITTPHGKDHFYDLWSQAGKDMDESINGWIQYDIPWESVPRYKNDGTLWEPEAFKAHIIKTEGIKSWSQNYACEFLGSSDTLIPGEILGGYKIKAPIDLDIQSQLKIYEEPIKGHKYIIGVDSSKEGQDFTGIQIFDIQDLKFKQVASAKLKIDYLMIPEILNEYGLKYNKALIIIENNEGSGQSIADILYRDYEYEETFFEYRLFKGVRKRMNYPGFRTTKLTRDLMLQVLKMIACAGRLELVDSETIKEFETFVLVKGKYQASGPRTHDDLVMATLLCFSVFKDSKTFEDIKAIIDGLKSGESISIEQIGISGFADGFEDYDIGNIGDYGADGL